MHVTLGMVFMAMVVKAITLVIAIAREYYWVIHYLQCRGIGRGFPGVLEITFEVCICKH